MRLRWKLTLSYTLVTAGAILLVEVVLLGVAVLLLDRAEALPRLLVPILGDILTDLAPDLQAQPPQTAPLQAWLENLVRTGKVRSNAASQVELNLNPAALDWALFLDRTPRVVAAYPLTGPCSPDRAPEDCLPPQALTVAQRALAGERRSGQLGVTTGQKMYAAVPVEDAQGRVVGALVLAVLWPNSLRQWPQALLGTLLPSAGVITLFVALIGTAFGYLTARGLTRRLQAFSQAADAWSRGNLSVQVRDTAADELGQLARHLNRMAEQLESLLQTRQELATLEERNRLARELHDAVKQQVFAAGMQIATAQQHLPQRPQEAQAALAQAEVLVQQAQRELTALLRELRPAALEGKGLVAALQTYLAQWQQQTGIPVDFRVQGQRALPLNVEQALFRVAQEALSNVAKHSQAGRVSVRLAWQGATVRLEIEDDGRGFAYPTERGKGLGLVSMEERLQALGGKLVVESTPGSGTRVVGVVEVG